MHTFYVGKNSKVRYVERHYGEGPGTGKRIMNPQTCLLYTSKRILLARAALPQANDTRTHGSRADKQRHEQLSRLHQTGNSQKNAGRQT